MTDELVINAAITGCVAGRVDNPHLPVTITQIVQCCRDVETSGAAIVHLHARGPDESPSSDAGLYRELVAAVRAACPDLVVCVSLSGRHEQDLDRRSAPLLSRPDMASLTLGSANFVADVNLNPPEVIRRLAARIYDADAIPELEVFDTGFAHYARYLIDHGALQPPYYFNLILGSLGSAPLDLIGLGHMVSMLPEGALWAVGGLGRFQLDANVMGLAAGGHVRVGLEDNLHFDRARKELADNARLVERVATIGRLMGREPASPARVRELLGLSPSPAP